MKWCGIKGIKRDNRVNYPLRMWTVYFKLPSDQAFVTVNYAGNSIVSFFAVYAVDIVVLYAFVHYITSQSMSSPFSVNLINM